MPAQKDRLYADVQFLTDIRPFRNHLNMDSLTRVVSYIRGALDLPGFVLSEQKWMAGGQEYTNVVATWRGDCQRRLVVGAHYDVCGDQPGADDNASAVAGLLETARLIAELKPETDYAIELVAYCLEEPPYFATNLMGSYIHAQSLHAQKADVIGMICYEMIGYFSDLPHSQPYPSPELEALYPHTANFIIVVGIQEHRAFNERVWQLMKSASASAIAPVDVQVVSFPGAGGLAGLSDHRNYWTFGYPALMINDTSFLRNTNYHQMSDTIDTLDFDKMTAVVDAAYHAITQI